MNLKRHPDYIHLRNLINGCEKLENLHNLREVVAETNKLFKGTQWSQDGIDLMVIYMIKEGELEEKIDLAFTGVLNNHERSMGAQN